MPLQLRLPLGRPHRLPTMSGIPPAAATVHGTAPSDADRARAEDAERARAINTSFNHYQIYQGLPTVRIYKTV